LWRRLFSDRDSLDVIERGGNHDLHPSAPGIGLWTKADSVTEFADLEINGTPVK